MNKLIVTISMLSAGLVHFIVAPDHYNHSPAHGIFFALAGLTEIVWAMSFYRRPNRISMNLGFAIAGGLITLWLLTRFLPSPFEGTLGAIEFWGVYSKTAELMSIVFLEMMAQRDEIEGHQGSSKKWRSLIAALLLAAISGLILFGGGRAAEPYLPSLAGEGHQDDNADGHEHQH
jgi:hypothetical protein